MIDPPTEAKGARESGGSGNPVRVGLGALAALGVAISAVALTLASLASRAWWGAELFTHFRLLHLVLTAVVTIVLFGVGWRRWALLGVAVAVGLALPIVPYWFGTAGEERASDRPSVKAMVLNLNLANTRTPELDRLLDAESPDLLLLLEVTPRWRSDLAALEAEFPHRVEAVRDDAFGIWLLSRHPLLDAEVIDPGDGVPSVAALVDLSGSRLAFLGTHPIPPIGRGRAAQRNAQLDWCADWVDSASERADGVLLMGDLNCSPFSPHFRDLLREGGLRDSALGRGLRATWFSGLPGLSSPIDHALVDDRLSIADRRVGPAVGGDHRAVIVEFVIRGR